jgi:PAS domain S-box-containing protein
MDEKGTLRMAATKRSLIFDLVRQAAAGFVALVGASVILGWALNSFWLKGGWWSGITVKTNTGIGLFLLGCSLWLAGMASVRLRVVGRVMGLAVLGLGTLTLGEHITGRNLGIDELFFREPAGEAATASPNRVGPPASVCFMLGGLALLLLKGSRVEDESGRDFTSPLGVAIAVAALLPALGYLYGARELYGIAKYTGIALPTAVTFMVLGLGIVFARPNGRVLELLRAPTAGGALIRRLLAPALLLPPVLGYLRTVGQRADIYDSEFGRSLLVISFILIFAGLVWWSGRALDRADRERGRAAAAEKNSEEARLLSEAKFQRLANFIPQLAWMARPDGGIFWYNQRWHNYCGTRLGELEGEGWQRVHDPVELPRVIENWRAALAEGKSWEDTFPLRRHDGEFRWHLSRAMPFRDERGRIVMWLGTNTDITEQRRIEQERQQLLESERAARTDAERASRLKDEFLSTLSHELRTPLNAILGWSQLLERGPQSPQDVKEGLSAIARNARAQTQLVGDLLDMSRVLNGKLRIEARPMDLAEVISAAVGSVFPAAQAKGIRIETVVPAPMGPINADAARLQQVVWNLLSNSVKFTPAGGRVEVRLARIDGRAEIRVSDTGEGIKPEFQPHLFDRFRQADATTTRRHGGLGLGLALVKQLVELHGGGVSAVSQGEGKGATFTVWLPLCASLPDEALAAPRQPEISLRGTKVLLVDDEADTRRITGRILEEYQAQVIPAASAMEALDALERERPDALLSDIGMPGIDGYELIRMVRSLSPQRGGGIPAAALTAFARAEDCQRALLAGFQAHLAKPVAPAELVAMVARLTGRMGNTSGEVGV